MEDVKWLLKKYGLLIVLMVIIVVICSIIFGKRGSEKNAEEVWEPPEPSGRNSGRLSR